MNKLKTIVKEERKETVLLIDVHNLTYRCVFVANKQDPLDENFTYWKFLVLNNILNNIKTYKADQCILAFDDRNYWRKKIYPEYKGQRKSSREESPVNFEKFFPIMHDFFEQFQEVFKNIIYLQLPHCEADDIIAVLTKYELKQFDQIINISNDRDMYQLMKFKNYRQYDPIKKKFIEHINSQRELLIKILTGDRSDNIPGVKDKCGPVTAKKMIDLGLDNSLLNESIKENFERNKQLIDFECIPYDVRQLIRKTYKEYKIMPFNGRKTFDFFVKNKLNAFVDRIQEYAPSLKQLV
jgi:5'-3' exonuclease